MVQLQKQTSVAPRQLSLFANLSARATAKPVQPPPKQIERWDSFTLVYPVRLVVGGEVVEEFGIPVKFERTTDPYGKDRGNPLPFWKATVSAIAATISASSLERAALSAQVAIRSYLQRLQQEAEQDAASHVEVPLEELPEWQRKKFM